MNAFEKDYRGHYATCSCYGCLSLRDSQRALTQENAPAPASKSKNAAREMVRDDVGLPRMSALSFICEQHDLWVAHKKPAQTYAFWLGAVAA
jgi:hypothetical protein